MVHLSSILRNNFYTDNGEAEVPCESDLSLALTLDVSDGCDITILKNPDDYSQGCFVKLSVNGGQEFEFAHTSISADVRFYF